MGSKETADVARMYAEYLQVVSSFTRESLVLQNHGVTRAIADLGKRVVTDLRSKLQCDVFRELFGDGKGLDKVEKEFDSYLV